MTDDRTPERDTLTERVTDGLRQAKGHVTRLGKADSSMGTASFVFSAGATVVAGVTSAFGPVVGEGIPGWRLACIVAAILGMVASLLTGLGGRLKLGEKRAEALQCVSRLKALEAALATGSRPRMEVAKEYEEVVRLYPDLIGL